MTFRLFIYHIKNTKISKTIDITEQRIIIDYMITKQKHKPLSRNDIDELLQKQTKAMGNLLLEQTEAMENLLLEQTDVILSAVDEKLARSEARVNAKIEKLIGTVDKFLKRLTDVETEFEMMKADVNRIKKVIREKLGVVLS